MTQSRERMTRTWLPSPASLKDSGLSHRRKALNSFILCVGLSGCSLNACEVMLVYVFTVSAVVAIAVGISLRTRALVSDGQRSELTVKWFGSEQPYQPQLSGYADRRKSKFSGPISHGNRGVIRADGHSQRLRSGPRKLGIQAREHRHSYPDGGDVHGPEGGGVSKNFG